jgi:PAS domain S-box-containing protein
MQDRDKDIAGAPPDYQRLFEEAPGLYMVLDPQLRVVAASNAYLEATLTSREAIIGRHVFEIFPDNPDDPSADSVRNSRASFNRVLQTRAPDTIGLQRHDVRRPESEGGGFEERYWSAINYPILNPDGSLAYIMHRVENVTEFVLLKQRGSEQNQLTDALREQAVQMEADLYARSREMAATSQKLKEANEELARLYEKTRELDLLKTAFFANLSHELRTPLTLILGPVEKLLDGSDLSHDKRRDLSIVHRNARLLLKNVNDLLDLSKLDAGGIQLEYARVELAGFSRFIASHFETVADHKQIHFPVVTPPELPAEVDASKLQRALFNLLSNAFKFTPSGGAVRFTLQQEQGAAVFSVEDTGPGIPPELRETIFERFRQADSGPTRKHGGTGLGLSIASEFVALHRGSIEVTETAEGGARFVVRVPLRAPEGAAVRTTGAAVEDEASILPLAELLAPEHGAVEAEEGVPLNAPLVLVVEDNPEMNSFIADVLRRGHRVVSALDGAEGLEKALRLRPDLVISDLMMPRMAGDEMISEIRKHRELDDVPILLLTAKADEELRVRLLTSGAQDSLAKPFFADELLARAATLVTRKRKAEESLRESEERFRATFENAAVGMAHVGLDGRWLRVNERLASLLGYSREELTSMTFQEVTHPEDLESDLREYGQLKRGEIDSYTIEKRYLRKDGRVMWGRLTVSLLKSSEGAALHAISIVEDITSRKEAEEALREAKEDAEKRAAVLDQVIEVLPVGLILADNSGRLYQANSALAEIWGATPLAAGIKEYRQYQGWWPESGKQVEPHEWPMARSVMERASSDAEIEIEAFDGKRKIIRAIAAPVVDRHGSHHGSVAVTLDITEQKRAVEELQKARDFLEERVKERTAELTQALQDLRLETEERIRAVEELRRGEQLLIQQSRMAAMGEMLRNISHQWRQPLNLLGARVQKLGMTYQYGGFSEELLKETVSKVMASIKQMSRTIDEFQDFLEPKNAKETFSVDDVIRKTISVMGEAFKSQKISIELQSSGDTEVYGDANEYGQVIMNLLGNAKDALLQNRETERRIWLRAWSENGRSVVTVTDNAGGIEKAISEKIFDAYFTTKELGKGTGVGLFLSKMIIEKNMGGRLSFRNVEEGAEFEIRLAAAHGGEAHKSPEDNK